MTEQELIDYANGILEVINQAYLNAQEQALLWCAPHGTQVEIYEALSDILNRRGGQGDAVERLKNYAAFQGVSVGISKKVVNNVYLGSVL